LLLTDTTSDGIFAPLKSNLLPANLRFPYFDFTFIYELNKMKYTLFLSADFSRLSLLPALRTDSSRISGVSVTFN